MSTDRKMTWDELADENKRLKAALECCKEQRNTWFEYAENFGPYEIKDTVDGMNAELAAILNPEGGE